jgi:hypothetical protein
VGFLADLGVSDNADWNSFGLGEVLSVRPAAPMPAYTADVSRESGSLMQICICCERAPFLHKEPRLTQTRSRIRTKLDLD